MGMQQAHRSLKFEDGRGNSILLHNYTYANEFRLQIERKGKKMESLIFYDVDGAKKRFNEEVSKIVDAETMIGEQLEYD